MEFALLAGLGPTCVMQAPVKATITATTLTVSWNCRNLDMLSYTLRPHMTALTMLLKLSSVRMMSEASLATSVPAMPCWDRSSGWEWGGWLIGTEQQWGQGSMWGR